MPKISSKKRRSVARLKAESGARVGSSPPYGYKKDLTDPKRHIVPDEETAAIVKYIFQLCIYGKVTIQITKKLKKDKIPTHHQKHGMVLTGVNITHPYNWSTNTIASILENEVYLGHTTNRKTTTRSFKDKKRIDHLETE